MKHFNFIVISLIGLLSFSCDYVTNVKDPDAPVVKGDRKVLVEDYTGHKCGNCPAAADTLKYLEKKYPGQIIPLAIHAGFFANINPTYPTDFRNPVGDAYDNVFGISLAGNPNGLVNRAGYGTGGFIKAYSTWEGEVVQMLSKAARFEIKLSKTYNAGARLLNTRVMAKSLTNNSGTYKLVVLLTEDSIIAEQIDYRLPSGSQLIPNYQFNHVLREAINNAWGDAVFTSGAVINDSIVKNYNNFGINTNYKSTHCHIIAYIYDADPNSPNYYEVLQAEEIHLE